MMNDAHHHQKIKTMKKDNSLQLLLGGALLAGGVYFLYFTERGIRLREKLVRSATDKMDEWLKDLEVELGVAEMEAVGAEEEEDEYPG